MTREEYYGRRYEEKERDAVIVLGCILGAGLIVLIAVIVQKIWPLIIARF